MTTMSDSQLGKPWNIHTSVSEEFSAVPNVVVNVLVKLPGQFELKKKSVSNACTLSLKCGL